MFPILFHQIVEYAHGDGLEYLFIIICHPSGHSRFWNDVEICTSIFNAFSTSNERTWKIDVNSTSNRRRTSKCRRRFRRRKSKCSYAFQCFSTSIRHRINVEIAHCTGMSFTTDICLSFCWIQVSYSAASPALSNRRKYPYFFRTNFNALSFNPVRVRLVKEFGWSRVALIRENLDVFSLVCQWYGLLSTSIAAKYERCLLENEFSLNRQIWSLSNKYIIQDDKILCTTHLGHHRKMWQILNDLLRLK